MKYLKVLVASSVIIGVAVIATVYQLLHKSEFDIDPEYAWYVEQDWLNDR